MLVTQRKILDIFYFAEVFFSKVSPVLSLYDTFLYCAYVKKKKKLSLRKISPFWSSAITFHSKIVYSWSLYVCYYTKMFPTSKASHCFKILYFFLYIYFYVHWLSFCLGNKCTFIIWYIPLMSFKHS